MSIPLFSIFIYADSLNLEVHDFYIRLNFFNFSLVVFKYSETKKHFSNEPLNSSQIEDHESWENRVVKSKDFYFL